MKIENIELSKYGGWKFTVKTDKKINRGDKIKFKENVFIIDSFMEFYRDGIKDEEIYLFLSPNEEAHEQLKVGDEVEFMEDRINA